MMLQNNSDSKAQIKY